MIEFIEIPYLNQRICVPLPDRLDHSMVGKLDSVEETLLQEVTRLKQAIASAHEALKQAGAGAKKDRAVLATLAVLDQARKA